MNPSPTSQTEQSPIFNILLGLAVLGVLLLNIQVFGTTQNSVNQLIINPHGGNYWLLTLVNHLFGNKMVALLSILFGASIVLFFAKSKAIDGISVPDLYIRRQFWLMAFGLLNGIILLWQNDLLFQYSIVGILLFPLYRQSARTLLIGAVVMGLIYGGKLYWDFSESKQKYEKSQTALTFAKKHKLIKPTEKQLKDTLAMKKIAKLSDEQKDDTTAWASLVKMQKFDKKADQAEKKSMRSSYMSMWNHVLPNTQWREAPWLYRYGLWDIASLMLLGMALFKLGFFSNALSTKQYSILTAVGLVFGQLLAWLSLGSYELKIVDFSKYIIDSHLPLYDVLLPFARAFSAIGWASLVICLYRAGILLWLWKAVETVGKMALSNYLLQTLICTLFFFGYGMSFFGELTFYQLYFVLAEIWLIQIVLSVVWLRYFEFGPAEWLWRSLILWKKQAIKIETNVEIL